MGDNNLQAGGLNKPKKGSLFQRATSGYKQARQIVGSLGDAWKSARKPSVLNIAVAHKNKQEKLKRMAQQKAEGKLGKKGH